MSNENQSDLYSHQLALKQDSTFLKSKSGLAYGLDALGKSTRISATESTCHFSSSKIQEHPFLSQDIKVEFSPFFTLFPTILLLPPHFSLLPICFSPVLSSSSSTPLSIFHPILFPHHTQSLIFMAPASLPSVHTEPLSVPFIFVLIFQQTTQKPEVALSVFLLEDYNQFFK